MKKIKYLNIAVISFLFFSLVGCVVKPEFNHKISDNNVSTIDGSAGDKKVKIAIDWQPSDISDYTELRLFPGDWSTGRSDLKPTRLPSGEAIAKRVNEVMSHYYLIDPTGEKLTITVNDLTSGFYFAGDSAFSGRPEMLRGRILLQVTFSFRNLTWGDIYFATVRDLPPTTRSSTEFLENTWDNIVMYMARHLASKINKAMD